MNITINTFGFKGEPIKHTLSLEAHKSALRTCVMGGIMTQAEMDAKLITK